MDFSLDHMNQDTFVKKEEKKDGAKDDKPDPTLNEEFQEAYKAFSASPWGAKIGGFLGNAVKQGQNVYQEASKEVAELGSDAAKGLSSLQEQIATRTRGLSINTNDAQQGESSSSAGDDKGGATPTRPKATATDDTHPEGSGYLERLRAEAAKRFKDLQKAEDAADEALLRFGSNIRDFLQDAVSIAPPAEGADGQQGGSTVLFESKDASGKRVIHTSRQDAQMHVIHTTTDGFAKDPATEEFTAWSKDFDVEKKTEEIADDLNKYPELRATMEKLVPDQVPYVDFWKRYYFLRHGLDAAEARRRDLLKAAAAEDDVGWGDDDSDDEDEDEQTATKADQKKPEAATTQRPGSVASSTTIAPPTTTAADKAKPKTEERKSNDDRSQADSEASYDVVGERSGVPSQAPSSPKDSRKGDDSDDDWE